MPARTKKLQDSTEARVEKANNTASLALARLRRYEQNLKAELATISSDIVSDLVAYASAGKPDDIVERISRAQAIQTVLSAIPKAVERIEAERSGILRMNAETANSAKRSAAKEAYKKYLQEFDAGYSQLAHSKDKAALHRATEELVKLARAAGMITDLRLRLKKTAWRGRHRVDEVRNRV